VKRLALPNVVISLKKNKELQDLMAGGQELAELEGSLAGTV